MASCTLNLPVWIATYPYGWPRVLSWLPTRIDGYLPVRMASCTLDWLPTTMNGLVYCKLATVLEILSAHLYFNSNFNFLVCKLVSGWLWHHNYDVTSIQNNFSCWLPTGMDGLVYSELAFCNTSLATMLTFVFKHPIMLKHVDSQVAFTSECLAAFCTTRNNNIQHFIRSDACQYIIWKFIEIDYYQRSWCGN